MAERASKGNSPLVLASRSPRRRELVRALGLPVTAVSPSEPEAMPQAGETPQGFAVRAALAKARSVAPRAGGAPVLGADTVVALEGRILGKPRDRREAARFLRLLRGRAHRVVTGLALVWDGAQATDLCESVVHMRPYTDAELERYVASGDPLDKAGAYAVQDATFRPAAQVEGCYLNVVGLPMCRLMPLLDNVGLPVTLRRGWRPPPECQGCPLEDEASRRGP